MTPSERAAAFLEAIEERAGILEHEAGFSRAEAEKLAGPMTLASFRDRDENGGPGGSMAEHQDLTLAVAGSSPAPASTLRDRGQAEGKSHETVS